MTRPLTRILQGVRESSWPAVAWLFSKLTADGYPLEFSFSSRDSAVRYVAEVAGPEVAESARFALALGLCQELAGVTLPSDVRTSVEDRQRAGDLLYGAWLGVTHGQQGDVYKIYAELPNQNAELLGATPVMLGLYPGQEAQETYYRMTHQIEAADVGLLLSTYGLGSSYRDLLESIEALNGHRSASILLPPVINGFSVSPAGPAVAFFCHADALLGSDACIRQTLLMAAPSFGWNWTSYLALGDNPVGHQMLSWIVRAAEPIELRVGVSARAYQESRDSPQLDVVR